MDYFSRKPDFPTFEDIYIARAQGAIELERRGDEVACRFGPGAPRVFHRRLLAPHRSYWVSTK